MAWYCDGTGSLSRHDKIRRAELPPLDEGVEVVVPFQLSPAAPSREELSGT